MFYKSFLAVVIVSVVISSCKKNEDNIGTTPGNPNNLNAAPENMNPNNPQVYPPNHHYPIENTVTQFIPAECRQPVTNQPAFGTWKKNFSDSKGIHYFAELQITNTYIGQRLRCSLPQTQRWIDTNVKSRVEVRFNVMTILETDIQDLVNDGVGGAFRCYNYLYKSVVNYETRGNNCLVLNPGPSADFFIR